MLVFDNKSFLSYLHIFEYMCKLGERKITACYKIFPHSNNMYIKILLENKFNIKFKMRTIQNIMKDNSWKKRNSLQEDLDKKNETLQHISEIKQMAQYFNLPPHKQDEWPIRTLEAFVELKNTQGEEMFTRKVNKLFGNKNVSQ